MISSRNENQFPSSFASLGNLLKALMFLSNLNNFNSYPSSPDQRFAQRKGSSKVRKEKCSKWFSHFFSLSLFLFMHYLCVLLSCFWVSLVFLFVCFQFFFVCFQFFFILFFYRNNFFLKNQKNTKIVCVLCTLVFVYLGWPVKQNFQNFVSFVT